VHRDTAESLWKHLAFAKLVAAFLRDAPASIFTAQLERDGTSSSLEWPSPILAFLKRAAWVPLRVVDDLRWAPPSACWYSSRSEPLPRFITRIDRALRDVLDSTESLVATLVNPLGLQLWSVSQSAAARIKTLGECLNSSISEAERDSFRKEYREAWSDWSKLTPRPEISGDCTLAVDIAGRLTPLPCPETAPVVYISDGTDPMLHQLLSALDRPIFEAPSGSTEVCADAVRRLVGRETRLLSEVDLKVEVDGQPFEASSVSSQLIAPETEWLAEISTLVLELRDNLSNRNTLRARQALYDSLRRIRVCFAGHISVGIDGFSAPLPALLLGVLPMRHESFPSLIIERAERLDWHTVTRLGLGLSILLDQVSLGNAFRLAFLALAHQLEGHEFERPDDEAVALAFQQPVERVREVYRSLRSNIQRTLRNLVQRQWLTTLRRFCRLGLVHPHSNRGSFLRRYGGEIGGRSCLLPSNGES
jgi:hypothetical protein